MECSTGESFGTNITNDVYLSSSTNEIGVFSQSNHAVMVGNMAYVRIKITPK